jgi:DnaJ homolog subfamily C member 28
LNVTDNCGWHEQTTLLIPCKIIIFRSETDIVNVVEQRIWHSMEEGHFENLPGKGKPLNLSTNPHADPAEDTLYRILSRNGCAPEWVELNKEIRGLMGSWRSSLGRAWGSANWHEEKEVLMSQMKEINNKVIYHFSDDIARVQ